MEIWMCLFFKQMQSCNGVGCYNHSFLPSKQVSKVMSVPFWQENLHGRDGKALYWVLDIHFQFCRYINQNCGNASGLKVLKLLTCVVFFSPKQPTYTQLILFIKKRIIKAIELHVFQVWIALPNPMMRICDSLFILWLKNARIFRKGFWQVFESHVFGEVVSRTYFDLVLSRVVSIFDNWLEFCRKRGRNQQHARLYLWFP